jgi:hypothetical protein
MRRRAGASKSGQTVEVLFKKSKPVGSDYESLSANIRVLISEDLWATYSPVRRASFCRMLANPNAFFYRNRPPGDPQKFGPFTTEEQDQVIARICYFHELGVEGGLWGLFAVPIQGRLGYQCANFYHAHIANGTIKNSSYKHDSVGQLRFERQDARSVPPEALEVLEREAIDYIEACLRRENKIAPPVSVDGDKVREIIPKRRQLTDIDEAVVIAENVAAPPARRAVKPPVFEIPRAHKKSDEEWSCVRYAIDRVTGKPMEEPYMDSVSGLVLDLSTWNDMLTGKISPAIEWWAESTQDLIKMTRRNYQEHRLEILNP